MADLSTSATLPDLAQAISHRGAALAAEIEWKARFRNGTTHAIEQEIAAEGDAALKARKQAYFDQLFNAGAAQTDDFRCCDCGTRGIFGRCMPCASERVRLA